MSLETYEAARSEAAMGLGISQPDLRIIEKATEPEVMYLGDIHYKNRVHPAFTGQSGNFDPIHPDLFRGGTRWTDDWMSVGAAIALVGELAVEMRGKRGMPEGGRKGLIVGGAGLYSPTERADIMGLYADLMLENGFAGPFKHIVSADTNTAGLSDAYVLRYHKRVPDDPLWHASAAGKSVKYGGREERPESTGLGTETWLTTFMSKHGQEKAFMTLMGFGQVAAWAALNGVLENKVDLRVNGISDRGGMLTTRDPHGLPITSAMVHDIGDNPNFRGDKIAALQQALAADGFKADYNPNGALITEVATDYFIPAAGPDVINLAAAKRLGARHGVIEAANGPTLPDAHKYLVSVGKVVAPDFDVNKQGVNCSSIEWSINVGLIDPDTVDPRSQVIADSKQSAEATIAMAEQLGTHDYRVAAAAVNLQHIARLAGVL